MIEKACLNDVIRSQVQIQKVGEKVQCWKGIVFFPLKHKKPLKIKDFVLGCKIVAPIWNHCTKKQLNKSRQRRGCNPQLVAVWNQTVGLYGINPKVNTRCAWCHTPAAITYSLTRDYIPILRIGWKKHLLSQVLFSVLTQQFWTFINTEASPPSIRLQHQQATVQVQDKSW